VPTRGARELSASAYPPLLASLVVALLGASAPAPAEDPQDQAKIPARTPFIRVLGTAQDGGLPHAACSCDRCSLARKDPESRRRIASLALVLPSSDQIYLIDATPDLRQQLAALRDLRQPPDDRVDRHPVDGVFLTHAHIGHYLGLAFFGYEAIHTRGLPVLATPKMATFLRANGPWSQLVGMQNIRLHELAPNQTHSPGDQIVVTAIQAPHRDEYADTLGFLMAGPGRTIFYLPDTDSWVAWATPVTELLEKVDIALLDGTFYSADELPGRQVEEIGHPLIEQSMDLLQRLVDDQGLQVYFTHLNHSNPALDPHGGQRQRIESRGFHILEEGQEFSF